MILRRRRRPPGNSCPLWLVPGCCPRCGLLIGRVVGRVLCGWCLAELGWPGAAAAMCADLDSIACAERADGATVRSA